MIRLIQLLAVLSTAGVFTALPLAAQAGEPEERRTAILATAREMTGAARYAALITTDDDGHPAARIMDPFPPEDDFTIWLATNARSRKVEQIRRDSRVTLLYFDADDPGYVTFVGYAEIVDDPAVKARWWKPEWTAFYDDENRGDDYLLIRVRPVRLELVSTRRGFTGDPLTWRAEVVDLR